MSIEVDWESSGNNSRHILTQEASRHVMLDTATLSALGVPPGNEKFATLVHMVNPITLSAGDLSIGAEVGIKGPNGEIAPVDSVRGLKVDSAKTISRSHSNGLAIGFVAISGIANLVTITGSVSGPATNILIFDSVTVPSNSAVPLIGFYVGEDSAFSFDYGNYGLPVVQGLTIVSSTTRHILTKEVTPNVMSLVTYWV